MDITFCDGCGEFIECYELPTEMLCEECYKMNDTLKSENLDWIKDAEIVMLANSNSRGVVTHDSGSKTLVVFDGSEWMSIPGYFGDEDASN